MSERPTLPQLGTLPLPREWARFLAALLAYATALEERCAALDARLVTLEKK